MIRNRSMAAVTERGETTSFGVVVDANTDCSKWPTLASLAQQRNFSEMHSLLMKDCETEAVKRWLNAIPTSDSTSATSSATSLATISPLEPSRDELGDAHAENNDDTIGRFQPALHYLLEFQPPLNIVERVIEILGPRVVPEDSVDAAGQTPLHKACLYQCDSSVVARLTHGNGRYVSAYRTTDGERGRTPLHCACAVLPSTSVAADAANYEDENSSSNHMDPAAAASAPQDPDEASLCDPTEDFFNAFETLAILLNAFPAAVHLRDASGLTPLDCAREQRADAALLRLLEEHCPLYQDSCCHPKLLSSSSLQHTLETTEETKVTASTVSSSRRNVDLVEPQDDVSTLGSHDLPQTIQRGPSKFERMRYEI